MQRAVILLPVVQEAVSGTPRSGDQDSECIVLVRIRHRARRTRQEAHIPVPVVAVEARRPCAACQPILADPVQAIGVRPAHGRADDFVHHLRVAC